MFFAVNGLLFSWLTIHSLLVRCDGRALDAHVVLLHSRRRRRRHGSQSKEHDGGKQRTRHEQPTFTNTYQVTSIYTVYPGDGLKHELEITHLTNVNIHAYHL